MVTHTYRRRAEEEEEDADPIDELSEKHASLVTEVLLRILDWIGVNKTTSKSAVVVWDMLQSVVPDP